MSTSKRFSGRIKRKQRIRRNISGTPEKPRLTIFRSLKHLYAQLIDDTSGKTIASVSTLEKEHGKAAPNKSNAEALGKRMADRAKAVQVETVVFDRNGFLYHGVVKAFADAAREGGLRF